MNIVIYKNILSIRYLNNLLTHGVNFRKKYFFTKSLIKNNREMITW